MTRLALHPADQILDATRQLLLEKGVQGATVDAIAARSRAPVGSLYHRFGSRDRLMAEMWIRAARRSQAAFVAAAQHADAEQAAVDAALSIYQFVHQHPEDARLLVAFRREDLIRRAPSRQLKRDLTDLNQPLEAALAGLARRLFGKATARTVEQTVLAAVDIPMGAIRRHLLAGSELPRMLPVLLEAAVRAVLQQRSS